MGKNIIPFPPAFFLVRRYLFLHKSVILIIWIVFILDINSTSKFRGNKFSSITVSICMRAIVKLTTFRKLNEEATRLFYLQEIAIKLLSDYHPPSKTNEQVNVDNTFRYSKFGTKIRDGHGCNAFDHGFTHQSRLINSNEYSFRLLTQGLKF